MFKIKENIVNLMAITMKNRQVELTLSVEMKTKKKNIFPLNTLALFFVTVTRALQLPTQDFKIVGNMANLISLSWLFFIP